LGDESYWPHWVAGAQQQTQVFSFGYPTVTMAWYEKKLPIPRIAGNLAHQLTLKGVGSRPVIYLGHSMGGLLLKQMLVDASRHGDAAYRGLWHNTVAICFLGTPHKGADVADLIERYLPNADNNHVQDLRLNAPWLDELSKSFRFLMAVRQQRAVPPAVMAYRETQRMKGVLVVPLESADPEISGAEVIDLHFNHEEIAKPLSRGQERCLWLYQQVEKARQIKLSQPHSIPSFVFVSYIHEAPERDAKVHELISWLISQGIPVRSDLDHPPGTRVPTGGWQTWAERSMHEAYTVLVVGSPAYLKVYAQSDQPSAWPSGPASLLSRSLFQALGPNQAKVMPVLFDGDPSDWVPGDLRPLWNEQRYPSARVQLHLGICTPPGCEQDTP
jgi:hypothetical protein